MKIQFLLFIILFICTGLQGQIPDKDAGLVKGYAPVYVFPEDLQLVTDQPFSTESTKEINTTVTRSVLVAYLIKRNNGRYDTGSMILETAPYQSGSFLLREVINELAKQGEKAVKNLKKNPVLILGYSFVPEGFIHSTEKDDWFVH